MGWGNCGEDSNGRPIGYVFEATCDHEGCEKEIDRGLSYVCGSMHGEDEYSCEGYFCGDHQRHPNLADDHLFWHHGGPSLCEDCAKLMERDEVETILADIHADRDGVGLPEIVGTDMAEMEKKILPHYIDRTAEHQAEETAVERFKDYIETVAKADNSILDSLTYVKTPSGGAHLYRPFQKAAFDDFDAKAKSFFDPARGAGLTNMSIENSPSPEGTQEKIIRHATNYGKSQMLAEHVKDWMKANPDGSVLKAMAGGKTERLFPDGLPVVEQQNNFVVMVPEKDFAEMPIEASERLAAKGVVSPLTAHYTITFEDPEAFAGMHERGEELKQFYKRIAEKLDGQGIVIETNEPTDINVDTFRAILLDMVGEFGETADVMNLLGLLPGEMHVPNGFIEAGEESIMEEPESTWDKVPGGPAKATPLDAWDMAMRNKKDS